MFRQLSQPIRLCLRILLESNSTTQLPGLIDNTSIWTSEQGFLRLWSRAWLNTEKNSQMSCSDKLDYNWPKGLIWAAAYQEMTQLLTAQSSTKRIKPRTSSLFLPTTLSPSQTDNLLESSYQLPTLSLKSGIERKANLLMLNMISWSKSRSQPPDKKQQITKCLFHAISSQMRSATLR